MRITRQYTKPGTSSHRDGFGGFFVCPGDVRARRLVQDGIATHLRRVREDDVPEWLWRHEPDEQALTGLPDDARYRGEAGIAEAVDRLAGAWAYYGWKGGYFDTEEDARAFFDEIRWLLFQGKCTPDIAQWTKTGLHWAYGIATGNDAGFLTDYRSGTVRRAESGDVPPHGMFINGAHGSLTGEGGGWDLWRREAHILSRGSHCGANVSAAVPGGIDGATAAFVAVGEASALNAQSASRGSRSIRRITIDGSHSDSREISFRRSAARSAGEFMETGRAVACRHIRAILDACEGPAGRRKTDPKHNPSLRLALQSARQAMVPEAAIRRALELTKQGGRVAVEDVFSLPRQPVEVARDADCTTATVIRVNDDFLRAAVDDQAGKEADLLNSVATAAWSAGEAGLDFSTRIATGNSCSEAGAIRSASGDGGYVFLDDTAAECATLNAAAFLRPDGSFDIGSFRHAARLMTLALDISLINTAQPSPRLARRVWDFRPLSLSLCGVGALLMAKGIPYDSDDGRAWCAGLCALLTGTAYLASSEIAGEMGAFPAWAENATAMRRVLDSHRQAVHRDELPMLAGAVRELWDAVIDRSDADGFRNAFVSAICTAREETAFTGCAAPGISPLPSLVRPVPTPRGGWRKTIEPAVSSGLRALGYSENQADAIVRHVVGHGTLAGAPGVNHETLRKRGFTEAAIATVESALADTDDISLVFNRWVLGDSFCQRMLGFTADELGDSGFDMLAALGFSDAGIEAANTYCCGAGTVQGAPHLSPEHVAVFDCAEPQGDRSSRQVSPEGVVHMMAAAQPLVSGGIGHTVVVPEAATIAECREMFRLAWRLGLKSLILRRQEAERADRAWSDDHAENTAERSGPFLIADHGHRVRMASAATADASPSMRHADPIHQHPAPGTDSCALAPLADEPTNSRPTATAPIETDIASGQTEPAGDAETSRCASSLAARGTASVPSSADAVVEQRQV